MCLENMQKEEYQTENKKEELSRLNTRKQRYFVDESRMKRVCKTLKKKRFKIRKIRIMVWDPFEK